MRPLTPIELRCVIIVRGRIKHFLKVGAEEEYQSARISLRRYFLGGSGGILPQKILRIWVLLHALWCNLERKVSGFYLE